MAIRISVAGSGTAMNDNREVGPLVSGKTMVCLCDPAPSRNVTVAYPFGLGPLSKRMRRVVLRARNHPIVVDFGKEAKCFAWIEIRKFKDCRIAPNAPVNQIRSDPRSACGRGRKPSNTVEVLRY